LARKFRCGLPAYAAPKRRGLRPQRRTIFGAVVGSLLIGVLLNGLVLMNVSSYIQQIVIGVIIVLAVDTFAKSRRRRL
jgi:ribose/xylose/arabinose/galactoside ABC-type transport system permease subunit